MTVKGQTSFPIEKTKTPLWRRKIESDAKQEGFFKKDNGHTFDE